MKVDKTKWEKKTFPQIGTSQLGKTLDSKKNKGIPYPYLCAANVGYGEFYLSDIKEILMEDDELERYRVKKGDMLICEGGDTGRCAIWMSDEPIYYQNALHRVRFSQDINNRFIMYNLHFYKKTGVIDRLSHGQTIKHFTQKGLNRLELYIPPLPVQTAIASELDSLQTVIDGYKAQLADLDALAQSVFLEMFGDPVGNPKGWVVKKLESECTDIIDGDHAAPPKSNAGIPFITISNIDKNLNVVDLSDTFYVPQSYYEGLKENRKPRKGDVLYTVTGSYGYTILIQDNKQFCFQRHIGLLRPKSSLNSYFLAQWGRTNSIKYIADTVATGVAQKTVSLSSLRRFPLILPPLPLQTQFASRVEAIERQKEQIRQQLKDAETLMAERMQYYFG